MKFITIFDEHSQYETYINDEPILPNLSFCQDVEDVHLNPEETRLIAKYNVTSTNYKTTLFKSSSNILETIKEIEIDGVTLNSVVYEYLFDTTGEHIVKYTFVDPTIISGLTFQSITNLTSIKIPNNVITIGGSAFEYCSNLTTVIIGNGVTTIESGAFRNTKLTNIIIGTNVTAIGDSVFSSCSSLQTITCKAMTAPSVQYGTFMSIKTGGTLYVPIGSSGYDVWMASSNNKLGQFNWTKVEQ